MLVDQVFVLIEINEAHKISYSKEPEEWVKIKFPNVYILDLDNFSDDYLIGKALQIIRNANKIYVFWDQKDSSIEPGSLLRFISNLLRQKDKQIKLALNGKNIMLEKMGKTLGDDSFTKDISPDYLKLKLENFFKA